MTQSELEQLLAGAIEPIADAIASIMRRLDDITPPTIEGEPIADVLAELMRRLDDIAPQAIEGARLALRSAIDGALLECQGARSTLQESATRTDRTADALRVQVSEALLELERRRSSLRDGADGVGIRAVSLASEADALTLEFTDDTRFECPLPAGKPGECGAVGLGIDAPAWQLGQVHRSGAIVQHYEGRTYRALTDTAEEPGDAASWERIGRLGLRWCGPFQDARSYEVGDLYVKGGTFQVFASGEHRCIGPKPLAPSEVRTIAMKQWQESEAVLRGELTAALALIERQGAALATTQTQLRALTSQVQPRLEALEVLSEALPQWRRDLDAVTRLAGELRAVIDERGRRS